MLQLADLTKLLICWIVPGKFTTAEACQTLQDKSKRAVQAIIGRLMKANLIRKGGMLGKTAYYVKI